MLCKYNYSYAKLVAAMLHLAKQQEVKALLLPTQNKTQSKQQHQSLNILVGLLYINNREGNLFIMKTSEFFINNGFWHSLYEDKLPENVFDAYNMCVEHIIKTSSCGDYLTHAGGEERGRLECCLCKGLFRRQIKPANRQEGITLIKHLMAWHGLSDYSLRTACIIADEIGDTYLVAKFNMLLKASNNDYVIGESPSSRRKLYNELFSKYNNLMITKL